MTKEKTDRDWETFAIQDPYWSVLTQDRFRKEVMDETGRREFFLTGERYIEWVFSMIRAHIDPEFNPATGLDVGCGVGRLLLPLARRCRTAAGMDVSDAMLREARKNCEIQKAENVSLIRLGDNCPLPNGNFDFINSFIVFQHIPCDRGLSLFRQLVGSLNRGGVGAIHVTYSRSAHPLNSNGAEYNVDRNESPRGGRYHLAGLKRVVRERIAGMFRAAPRTAGTLPAPSSPPAPVMQMNSYLLNPLFQILQGEGVREMHLAFSDHDGCLGAVLLFKKAPEQRLYSELG